MVSNYLTDLASQFGVPIWLFIIIFSWIIVWKLLALWKSARNNHIVWFIVLAILNTVGILEILYIYVFSKMGKKSQRTKLVKVKKKKK